MKKLWLLVLVSFGLVAGVKAAPRLRSAVDLVGVNDGNKRTGVTVTCSNSAWTQVVASREERRALKLKASDSNDNVVCLGTDDSGGTCVAGHHGYELGTGDEYNDSSEAALYCRAASGAGSQTVKGFELYDTAD